MTMKKTILSFGALVALTFIGATANAQDTRNSSSGDLYKGMSRAVPANRTILPYGLEVTFDKTTHLIFPSAIRYVDLGSSNLVASQAEDATNVLRVKASVKGFETETNLSVICEDGSFYAFNVKYANEPEQLSIEMKDFLRNSDASQSPSNRSDIYFSELGDQAPVLVQLIMKSIFQNHDRYIRHIGAKQFGMRYSLDGIYTYNGLIYFQTMLRNSNNLPYAIDHVSFRVVDKETAKRQASQELELQPLRSYNDLTKVKGHTAVRTVYALEAFTVPDDKQLLITLHEYNGGRTMTLTVDNDDIVRAKNIDNLKLEF